jgi:acetylglutamate kinase
MNPLVIKVGGAFIDAPSGQTEFFTSVKNILQYRPVILVHGGGAGVQDLLGKLGFTSQKVSGLRVTPPEHIPYVAGALAGQYATKMLSFALGTGLSPVSLTLADGQMTECARHPLDVGNVGIPSAKNPKLLTQLCQNGFLPIINSIGADKHGDLMNVNADQAATVIATLADADLMLLSDVPGVLDQNKQKLPTIDQAAFTTLVDTQVITDGMIVKVAAALESADILKRRVIIGDWSKMRDIDAENLSTFGTHIIPE